MRLAGDRVPGAPVGKLPDAVGIFPSDLFGRLKCDQISQCISGKLSEQAAPGAFQHFCFRFAGLMVFL